MIPEDIDIHLLRQFAVEGSETAFAELVRRRIDLVYSVALRVVGGDGHLAKDVTQSVFLDLARQAKSLCRRPVLVSWLYTSTRFAAAKAVRTQARWLNHQREVHAMQQVLSAGATPAWEEIRPVLDEAMGELAEADRTAILLRFFEGRPLAQVGRVLGVAENAARMRVDRALDKLRAGLARRGVTSTAAALGAILTQQPVVAAPAGLATLITGNSLAGATAGTAVLAAAGAFMGATKIVLAGGAIVAVFVLAIGLGRPGLASPQPLESNHAAVLQEESNLQVENRRLSAEVRRLAVALETPARLPAVFTGVAVSAPTTPTVKKSPQAVLNNLQLISAAADRFRIEHGRSPASLDEIVGPEPTKYLQQLKTVGSESYEVANGTDGYPVIIAMEGQFLVYFSYEGNPLTIEMVRSRALEIFRAVNDGQEPSPSDQIAFFGTAPNRATPQGGDKSSLPSPASEGSHDN